MLILIHFSPLHGLDIILRSAINLLEFAVSEYIAKGGPTWLKRCHKPSNRRHSKIIILWIQDVPHALIVNGVSRQRSLMCDHQICHVFIQLRVINGLGSQQHSFASFQWELWRQHQASLFIRFAQTSWSTTLTSYLKALKMLARCLVLISSLPRHAQNPLSLYFTQLIAFSAIYHSTRIFFMKEGVIYWPLPCQNPGPPSQA